MTRPPVCPVLLRLAPLLVAMAIAGCDNRIGGGRTLSIPDRGDARVFVPSLDAEVPAADAGADAGVVDTGVVTTFDPFPFGSVGERCVSGAEAPYLILAGAQLSCAQQAAILEDGPDGTPVAYAALDDLSPGRRELPVQVCLTTEGCEARTLDLDVLEAGPGQPLVARWAIALDGIRAAGEITAPWCDYQGSLGGGALATGLEMTEVALYQGVKIALMQNGQPIRDLNAPIIGGRRALVRVFVAPEPDFAARDIVARLRIEAPGQDPVVLEETVRVSRQSGETAPDSTFNFDVSPQAMSLDARFSVGLYETAACGGGSDPQGVLYPATGFADLSPRPTGGPIEVVLVPVRYDADGSGRLPDVSQAQLDRYRDTMFGMFPVPEVSIRVREPLPWGSTIARNGAGWGDILQAILQLRNQDRPEDNTYYYGIFAPSSSFSGYCSGGCVAGLGPVPSAGDTYSRGAVGLGFSGQRSTETFVHEIGHALGRLHAPCRTNNADPGFPYSDGRLGVWGFDIVTRTLKDPNQHRDMMGYCDPNWISDYNYEALFQRISAVNGARPVASPDPREWKVLMDDMDGVRWGRSVILERAPLGEPVGLVWRDATGSTLSQATGHGVSLDHVEGRYVLLPEPPDGAASVSVDGAGTIAL